MTFWKKLTQPPAVEPYPVAPVQDEPFDPFPALGVAVSTWVVGESLGGTTPEILALIAYPNLVRLAAEFGANQGQGSTRSPGTTPPVQ